MNVVIQPHLIWLRHSTEFEMFEKNSFTDECYISILKRILSLSLMFESMKVASQPCLMIWLMGKLTQLSTPDRSRYVGGRADRIV